MALTQEAGHDGHEAGSGAQLDDAPVHQVILVSVVVQEVTQHHGLRTESA